MKRFFRLLLRIAGKRDRKVIAVFGRSAETCHKAVTYVYAGESGLPIWLFCGCEPNPATAELCQRMIVRRSSLACLIEAEVLLWRQSVALSVGAWTGEKGGWPLKLAPFLIPPFRALFLNASGDFLNGNSSTALLHAGRCLRNRAQAFVSAPGDRVAGWWKLLTYHIWRGSACTRIRDVVCAMAVKATAQLLKLTGNPHRSLLGRLRGGQDLEVTAAGVGGVGIARFQAAGRDWRGAGLEAEMRSSGARLMIWQTGNEESVEELLPLFDDERTFAVSVQVHYRGWSPSLLPMAPFRPLEPGEAAAVLAPISSTIVVDRLKLAALGIPRCGLSATAWLQLFWKAAAAGWRSYSVGNKNAATPLPDLPEPEAAFFLRLLTRRELRKIGPREPDVMRGNLAFRPHRASAPVAESGRLRVLVVSPFLPFPLSHGGAVRIWNLCRALRERVDFFLIAVREREDRADYDKLGEVFREIHVIDLDERPSRDDRLPTQVRHHQSRSLTALIGDVCRRVRPDLIQIEYTHMAHFRDAVPDIPSILVEHDLTFTLYRQLMENEPDISTRREYERWHGYERRHLRAFDGVWTMSDEDRRVAVREGSHPDRVFTVPNGVDANRFRPNDEIADPPEILYVGSFRHLPNILGFEMLLRRAMPRVWERHPRARLRVVAGPQHESFWKRFRNGGKLPQDDRIEIHGFVPDLRPFYARATAVAVPLEVSAGTNIKVLEAMACGKAIITTPPGCAGLGLTDGAEVLIRDPDEFAAALCRALESGELRQRLECRARKTAEERFRWEAIADRAYVSYRAVCGIDKFGEIQSRAS